MIKVCLFDLDGTVADTNSLIFESFRHTFKEHGIEDVRDDEIYSFFGEPLFKTMERFASVEDAPNLVQTYRDYNETKHDEMIAPFELVEETLAKLAEKGIKLGIVTSKRKEMAERSLKMLHLTPFFEVIVTPEDTLNHKPNKDPVEFALKKFQVEPKEAIMIGDSPFDLLSGKEAGTYTCGVEYTRLAVELLKEVNPDYLITSFGEIPTVIDDIDQKDK